MKAVSAAKMRRAQDQVISARPYSKRVREVLGRVATYAKGVSLPLLEEREPKNIAFILITADRGLCGGFNGNLIRKTVEQVRSFPNVNMVCAGRKGRDFFRRRGFNIAGQYIGLGETIRFSQAQEIARFVMDKYISGEFDVVYMVFSEFVNVLIQRPTIIRLLPIEPPPEGSKTQVDYIFEPSPEGVLAELLPLYVENMVFHGLLESKAGEQSARMTAMDAATKNAGEMIDRLTLAMNRARQTAITKEITEIVGGAAALE